ncbi:hypothetical protein DSCA_64350 [Desulfosarcina alkanivorans]|uniref:AMIN domain-containing protein n=2 Tax=Desulfosarcina alkanivorans TaxID=571177 RepID=A0A5K7YVR6_9BACT|nr:hypothetical protein DSCA_64350 [Desulfosarcina alkanivorans]
MLLAPILSAEATVVKNLRFGDNKGYVRMVLEVDRALAQPPSVSINGSTIQVAMTGVLNHLPAPPTEASRDGIVSLDVTHVSDVMRIDAAFPFAPADIRTFSLTGPHRFIIDAYRPSPSADEDRPIDNKPQTTALESGSPIPKWNPVPDQSTPFGGTVAEASMHSYGSLPSLSADAAEKGRNRFQQQLIAALIGVTSIIVVLLFFLIWMGSGRKKPREPSWIQHLPPARDPAIENIDAAIRDHLKRHDHQ